ncbi:hypothetical protein SUDANB1_04991 [Streptomyces sp. enrichment culture]
MSYWIADRDLLAVPSGKSPLLGATRVDFWKPFPWGADERGNPVMATMLWLSLLVGAVPRQGKTFSARTIALAAALDPYVRLYVFDGKASPDWRKFALVAPVRDGRLHDARHTAATVLLILGVPSGPSWASWGGQPRPWPRGISTWWTECEQT